MSIFKRAFIEPGYTGEAGTFRGNQCGPGWFGAIPPITASTPPCTFWWPLDAHEGIYFRQDPQQYPTFNSEAGARYCRRGGHYVESAENTIQLGATHKIARRPGALFHPALDNGLSDSSDFADWTTSNATVSEVSASEAVPTPEGETTRTIATNTTDVKGYVYTSTGAITYTVGGYVTCSLFVKYKPGESTTRLALSANQPIPGNIGETVWSFDSTGPSYVSSAGIVVAYGADESIGGWYRLWIVVGPMPGPAANVTFYLRINDDVQAGTYSVFVWDAQVNEAPCPCSVLDSESGAGGQTVEATDFSVANPDTLFYIKPLQSVSIGVIMVPDCGSGMGIEHMPIMTFATGTTQQILVSYDLENDLLKGKAVKGAGNWEASVSSPDGSWIRGNTYLVFFTCFQAFPGGGIVIYNLDTMTTTQSLNTNMRPPAGLDTFKAGGMAAGTLSGTNPIDYFRGCLRDIAHWQQFSVGGSYDMAIWYMRDLEGPGV